MGNLADLVVAAGDSIFLTLFCNFNFVGAELGVLQNVDESFKDIVEVALQARKTDRRGVRAPTGLNFRGTNFEEVVQLIAGLRLRASGTPYLSVDIHEADLADWLIDRPAANASGTVDQRQFVILLQKNHHAV